MNLRVLSAALLISSYTSQLSGQPGRAAATLVVCTSETPRYLVQIDNDHRVAHLSLGEPDASVPIATKTVKFDENGILLEEITGFERLGIPEVQLKISRIYSLDRVSGKLHIISNVEDQAGRIVSAEELKRLKQSTSESLKRMSFASQDQALKSTYAALDPWKWTPIEVAAGYSADLNCERAESKF
jgi:hypothetical protein